MQIQLSQGPADNINGRVQEITQQQTDWKEVPLSGRDVGSESPDCLILQFHLDCVYCDLNLRKIVVLGFEIKIPNVGRLDGSVS